MGKLIPILFNTEMVKAIMDGRKTVTRRLAKGFLPYPPRIAVPVPREAEFIGYFGGIYHWKGKDGTVYQSYPPCDSGDIFYVRETWRKRDHWGDISKGTYGVEIEYKAGGPTLVLDHNASAAFLDIASKPWRPSIHMPKATARIFLRVTAVRPERLQNITDTEALKEGCTGVPCFHPGMDAHGCVDCYNTGWLEPPSIGFMNLWDSTIKPADLPKYGWDANPWIWVIEFERCEKPDNFPDINVGKKENGNEA